jgi:hypothetical protein
MKLRYLQDVSIKKAIIHVLDKGGDEPVLNSELLDIGDAFLNEFVTKHVTKSLNNDNAEKIVFENDEFIVDYVKNLKDDQFVEYSQKIAVKLFDLIKADQMIPSCDLLICEVSSDFDTFYGILKLDYQPSYTHKIDFKEDELQVSLIPHNIGLPSAKQKLKKCIFIGGKDDEFNGLVINNNKKADSEYKQNYFVTEFVKGKKKIHSTQKTKIVKAEVEKWARKNLKEDIEKASELRENLNKSLVEEDSVELEKITDGILTTEQEEDMRKHIEKKGIDYDDRINVDRKWVEKKMKSKSLKTDTGVTIRGKFEVFEDKSLFEMKRNGDGTVDYIIKNVRNISER